MDKGISASSRSHPLTNMQTDLSAACFSDNQREVLGEFASGAIGTHSTQDEKSDGLENAGRVPCPSLLQIRQEFSHCFIRQGFKEEPAARLASGVDPTVLFVGSNISTLKKYILDRIPCEGVVVVQPSLRFRELKMLFNSSYKPLYGAYFDEMGAITPHTNPERLTDLLLEYLTGSLGLTQGDLVARVSSRDPDLLNLATRSFKTLEIDSKPDKYYRHSIGELGYAGRNFNIALRNMASGVFDDIGNFLAFTKNEKPSFFEIALGDTVISRAMNGHDHVLDCYGIAAPTNLSRNEQLNFINSIIVTTVLYREGMRASNSTNQGKILSRYLRYIFMLNESKGVSQQEIEVAIISFEISKYGESTKVANNILGDIATKANHFKKTLEKQLLN